MTAEVMDGPISPWVDPMELIYQAIRDACGRTTHIADRARNAAESPPSDREFFWQDLYHLESAHLVRLCKLALHGQDLIKRASGDPEVRDE